MKLRGALVAVLVIASVGVGASSRPVAAAALCSPGYHSATGMEPCTPAAPGRYAAGDGATTDLPCMPGTYQNQEAQSECKSAPKGSFVDVSEAIDFTPCPAGFWQANEGEIDCDPADPGTFVAGEGSFTAPTPCPAGSWQDAFGASSCKLAQKGQFVAGVGSTTAPIDCEVGKYQPLQGQSVCMLAPPGSFVDTTGADDFTLCALGRWQAGTGEVSCDDADPGTFVDEMGRFLPPSPCPAGFWQGSPGAQSCDAADPGRYVPEAGSSTPPVLCPPGKYQPGSGQSSCIDAPAGTFVPGSGANDFTVCSVGRYQPRDGEASCIDAPAGSFVDTQQATEPTPCAPGTYQPDSQQIDCIDAPPGSFVAGEGKLEFDKCTPGTYQPSPKQSTCIDAPPGTYVPDSQATDFVPCVEGTYQTDSGKTECIDAPAGSFVDTQQATVPTPCAPGTYQPNTSAQGCIEAPPGAFVSGENGTTFTVCAPGSYQPVTGAATCELAAVDFFVAGSSALTQTRCTPGFTTNSARGAVACVAIVAPSLTVPKDLTIETNDAAGRAVDFEVKVTDDVDGATFTCSKPSGALFPVGDTTVNCEAVDRSSTSSFASFTITVAFVPRFATGVAPARLLETRASSPTVDGMAQGLGRLPAGNRLRLEVAGRAGIDADATAVVVNVTAIAPSAIGFLTVHPCLDTVPTASSLNYAANRTAGNEIVAQLDATGSICIFNSAETHLAIDVVAQVPATSNYLPVAPARLTDTRANGTTIDGAERGRGPTSSGQTTTVQVRGRGGISADARAVVVNVTAISPAIAGYITVHPCLGTTPLTASLNFEAGLTRGNEIIAEVDSDGRICIFTQGSTHLSVDVVGQLAGPSDFASIGPARLLDSRPGSTTVDGRQQAVGSIPGGTMLTIDATFIGGPTSPDGIVANITAIRPKVRGFLTVWNCVGDRPLASSLNFGPGDVVGNHLIIETNDAGKMCVYASATVDITVDAVGYRTSVT